MIYRTFEIFSIFYFYFIMILNVSLDRTIISESVSDTIQFFMRRKSWAISSAKLMTWNRDADMTVIRLDRDLIIFSWRKTLIASSWLLFNQLLRQKKIFTERWTRHDIEYFFVNCIIKKLYSPLYWLIFRYVLVVRFVRFLIIFLWLFSCQCRFFINWYVNLAKLFFLF